MTDGFVKSPSAALRCILRHCGVPKKYASFLRICAPCIWSFLRSRPLSILFTRLSSFIGNDPSPEVLCAPDTGAEGLELNNLAVVNKQIDLRPVVLEVPWKGLRLCGLKHPLFQTQDI